MDLLSVVEKAFSWLAAKRKERAEEMREYLSEIEGTCRDLVAVEDPLSDEATLLHEQVKSAYEAASRMLTPEMLTAYQGDLYRGLSSARIYYWLRVLEAKRTGVEEIQALLFDREQSPVSFELMAQLLADAGDRRPIDLEKVNRDRLRQICLRDIQRISEVRQAVR